MKKLCCIFNYAPLYRQSIFKKIDDTFDTQFCFDDLQLDIAKLDYNFFKKYPKTIHQKFLFHKILWRQGIQGLPYKNYDYFLIIGDFSLSYIPFLLSCKIKGKKVYAWGHGLKTWGKHRFINKLIIKLLDVFFTYGEGGRQRMIKMGVKQEKLHVIFNSLSEGVDISKQTDLKSDIISNHFQNNFSTFVFVGRLTKVKQIDWIIEAMKIHKEKGLYYNLLIIGDGTERSFLTEKSVEYGLQDNIWFYGECYDEEKLNKLIYNTDLCISPGNVGLTALHSMMYGVPVLTHDSFEKQMPEYETVIQGKTGALYKYGSFEDFCRQIELWLKNENDRESIRYNCYNMINGKWNSRNQISIFETIIK